MEWGSCKWVYQVQVWKIIFLRPAQSKSGMKEHSSAETAGRALTDGMLSVAGLRLACGQITL